MRSSAIRGVFLIPGILVIASVAVFIAGAVHSDPFSSPAIQKVQDFGLYWSSARVALEGGNPYDPEAVWPYQKQIEPGRESPQLPWGPPWSLGLLYPFASVDFPVARWAWLLFSLALILASAAMAWQLYGVSTERIAQSWLIALSFYPSILVTALGQQTVFPLAAVAGFLWCQRSGWPFFAGLFLGLTLAKPQNLILVWAAVAVVELIAGRWKTIAGLAVSTATLSILAAVPDPDVYGQYLHAMTHYPPSGWMTPTIGTYLRMTFGGGLGVSFLSLFLGAVWLAWFIARHWRHWIWVERMPAILFASYLASPYGWAYDLVVLLIPIIQAAAVADASRSSRRRVFLASHLGLTGLCLALNVAKAKEHTFVWLAPALLLLWLLMVRRKAINSEGPGISA